MEKRILSGIRPTGTLHIGHYFGTLQNWVYLQKEYECFFMIADWHALTDRQTYENLNPIISEIVLLWLASGIDPRKSIIFRQSDVIEHAEMEVLLSMTAKIGDLKRIPAFKDADKSMKNKLGLLIYPLLQAADILVYRAEAVPVGEDQVPHVEYARILAQTINKIAQKQILPLPKVLLTKTKRIPGTDGQAKMSKSLNNTINLLKTDFKSTWPILSKLQTDPNRVTKKDAGDPQKCPIIFPYANLVMNSKQIQQIKENCKNAKWGCIDCKREIAKSLDKYFRPLREKYFKLKKKKGLVTKILAKGKLKAKEEASKTLFLIRPIFGL